MDTAVLRAGGDVTPDGEASNTYGTPGESLTGEHDELVDCLWRVASDDARLQTVRELPIGETDTKVVEARLRRRE